MTIAELAGKTIEVLEKRGWIQHDAETDQGVCLIRAAQIASEGDQDAYRGFRLYLASRLEHGSVTYWNDTPGRTIAEVFELLMQVRDARRTSR